MAKKTKKISKSLKNSFVPHAKNNYRPHIIRHHGLALILFLLLGFQVVYNYANTGSIKILGYATNVTNSGLLQYTNENRTRAGLTELYLNDDLNKAAQAKAEHMVANNYWAHYAPDGTTPWDFINKTTYEYLKAGENLAYGFTDSAGTVRGWMNSEPHAANIMDANFAEVGFGMASGSTFQGDENTVIVAMYGQPLNPVTAKPSSTPTEAETLSWTPQDVIRADTSDTTITVTGESKNVNVLSAAISGQAHWGLYATLTLLMTLAFVYAMRHAVAIHQFATHGEHFIEGHPMIEAGLIYGLLWLLLASTYGVIR